MAGNRTTLFRASDGIPVLRPDGHDEAELRRHLQEEIDKLALLIEQVKKQSDRVQATADAIADKILLAAPPPEISSRSRRSGPRSFTKTDGSAFPV
jgi:hypothetical protein